MTRNLKILVSLLLLSAALAISGAVGHAATYIAQFVYGVRYDKQALKPSNCTTGRVCDWVDTNGKKHFWNGTADQTFPLVTPTAKGDIIAYTGTAWDKKAVGTNGYCLKADSTQTTGLVWASCGGGGSGSLQNAYDNSSNPVTITEDNTLGALFIKANSNGDSPLGIKNNAGSLVAHFDADGALETRYLYTTSTATDALQFEAATANSSTNNAFQFNNTTALGGSTTLATFGSNSVVKASIYNDGTYLGPHFESTASAPTCSINTTVNGTGGSCNVSGNFHAGKVTITGGTGGGFTVDGTWITLTHANSYTCTNGTAATFFCADTDCATLTNQFNISGSLWASTSTTAAALKMNNNGIPHPANGTAYEFFYRLDCY